MKQCVAIAVLFAILAQTFSRDLIVAHFYLNREYIATHFCENRDRPELHCRGKCQLKKTLKKDRQHDTRFLTQDRHDLTLFYSDELIVFLPGSFLSEPKCYPVYNDPAQKNIPDAVFHPPAAIC